MKDSACSYYNDVVGNKGNLKELTYCNFTYFQSRNLKDSN